MDNRYSFAGGNPVSFVELDGHLFGMSWSDVGHAALDVAGMVAVIGEVADVANGVWYLAEGNYVDAAMSMASAIPLAGNAVAAAKLAKTGKKIADGIDTMNDTSKAAKAGSPSTGAPKPNEKGSGGSCTKPNSFVPGTRVVLADGSSRTIEDIEVGDRVLATDVETGQNQDRIVTNARSVAGKKTFVTFTVDVDGKDGSKTGSITSTDAHLIWLPDAGMWAKAEQLKPGMWLQTAAGTWVQITAVKRTVKYERVHNLTVNGVHSYYVVANGTPLLVHNNNCFDPNVEGADLPTYSDGGPTVGRGVSSDGRTYDMTSGNKQADADLIGDVNQRLREAGHLPGTANSSRASDLEQKFAAVMHRDGIDDADLVINNPAGPCMQRLGCNHVLDDLLGGKTLRVHWPNGNGGWTSRPYGGRR